MKKNSSAPSDMELHLRTPVEGRGHRRGQEVKSFTTRSVNWQFTQLGQYEVHDFGSPAGKYEAEAKLKMGSPARADIYVVPMSNVAAIIIPNGEIAPPSRIAKPAPKLITKH